MAATATPVKGKQQPGKQQQAGRPAAPGPDSLPGGPPVPPGRRRRGVVPLTPMRHDAAKSMVKLADDMKASGPDIPAHQHVRDAARLLRSGNEEAAGRHLRAAMFALTPQSLHRNGIHNDDGHTAARSAMHHVHRHLLLVKDIQDAAAKNETLTAPPQGPPAGPQDPNGGYGPGALAQKPTARQPGGNRAMNAPSRSNTGGTDPNVANPVGPQRKGSKQFTYGWGDLEAVIDLAFHFNPGELRNHHGEWSRVMGAVQGDPAAGFERQKSANRDAESQFMSANPAWQQRRDALPTAERNRYLYNVEGGMHPAEAVRRAERDQRDAQREQDKLDAYHKDQARMPKSSRRSQLDQEDSDPQGSSGGGDELANDYRFSAETGRLAVTPAPYGKPGGPGLYHVKGLKHSDYLEQIVHALMRKGMDKGKATAIARGSIRRWMRGGGHVHPEVRAAAGVAEAEELKAQARAHAHANTWDEVAAVVELAFLHHFDPAEPRGKEGEWTGGLGGLADKLDADHPGKGFGDEVRKAKDAATTGDRDKAGEHLENAYEAVRGRAGAVGSKTAEGRKAAGNAFLLDQKMRQLSGGVALARARTWGDAAWEIELAAAAPGQARVPAGQAGGGQFGSSGAAAASGGSGSVASQHASLSAKISTARKRLTALQAQQKALQAALATASSSTTASQSGATTSSQSGATTAGQSGATTTGQAGATTASQAGAATAGAATAATTPSQSAATSSAAVTPSQAGATTAGQAGATTASQAGATTASQAGATTPSAASAASPAQVAQWTQQLGQVNQQITTVTNQITAWQKQLGQGSGGSSGSAQGAAA